MKREELINLLQTNGIDPSRFGIGTTKSLDDLVKEIETGETKISQRVVREVSVVTINVFADVDGVRYRLVEVRQEFKDGRERTRTQLSTSIQEKKHPGETSKEAIDRGLKEEIGVARFTHLSGVLTFVEVLESPSFPGVLTIYRLERVDVLLDPSEYKPTYKETEADLTSFFEWVLST